MTQATRTFRIFVSSTFSDLKTERNALQEHVFPRLRELCAAHGTRFQAIDLRWGVSEEAALDQQTMRICLGEIARCQQVTPRPNFIVLLGDRYGWRPLPEEIPADEFEEIGRRVTDKEAQALLAQWYRRDDNAVPPVYVLQPRTGEYEDYAVWDAQVERPLRAALLQATAEMKLTDEQRLKYEASATHQEIVAGALRVEDAPEHVFCFSRTIKGLPQDESARDYLDLDAEGNPDEEVRERQERLKGELRELLPGNVHEYRAEWTGEGVTTDHLDRLCEDVYQSLSRIILQQITKLEAVKPLEAEIAAHGAFGQERAKHFVGRAGMLEAIGEYVAGGDRHTLAIWGESGSGKSALMAKAVQQAREAHPEAEAVYRFIGATPDSSSGRALVEGLCREISRRYGVDEADVPSDYRELIVEFPKRLALATAERPLVMFLDALDQISDADNARNLTWLPAELPEHVRAVVSTIPGECQDVLERKLPGENLAELKPMPASDGAALLDLWLAEAGRRLQPEQWADVLDKFEQCGLPLYLKLAFEEARRWRSYDGLPKGADDRPGLSADVPGVIRDLFRRLSQEANHGEMLVSRSLGYLAAAKNGLGEDEVLDVLSQDEDVMADFHRRSPKSPEASRLPVVVWSRFYFDIEPYLMERSADSTTLLSFYHPTTFGQAVAKEYLVGEEKQRRHRELARYFGEQALQVEKEEKKEKIPNLRKLSELPYQQTKGKMWNNVLATLTDFDFVESKCTYVAVTTLTDGTRQHLGVYEVLADYERALTACPIYLPHEHAALDAFRVALGIAAHNLVNWPELTFQEVYPRVTAHTRDSGRKSLRSRLVKRARSLANNRWPAEPQAPPPSPRGGKPWLRQLNVPESGCPMVPCYGHQGSVNAVAIAPGERLVSVGDDGTLRLWKLASGQELTSVQICHHRLVDVQLFRNEERGVILCEECGLFDFDLRSSTVTPLRAGIPNPSGTVTRPRRFRGCRFSPFGYLLVAQGDLLWLVDLNSSCPAVSLRADLEDFSAKWTADHLPDDFADQMEDAEFGEITCIAPHPRAPLALIGYATGGMLLWNLGSRRVQDYLPLHWRMTTALFHPNGRYIYMGGNNPATGHERFVSASLTRHRGLFVGASALHSRYFNPFFPLWLTRSAGMLIGRDCRDWKPRVLMLRCDQSEFTWSALGRHSGGIRCATLEEHGQWAASGGHDGTVQIWDLAELTEQPPAPEEPPWLGCRLLAWPPRVVRVSRAIPTGDAPHFQIETLDLPDLEVLRRRILWARDAVEGFVFAQDGPLAILCGYVERGMLDELALEMWHRAMEHFPEPSEAFTSLLLVRNLQTGRTTGMLRLGQRERILSASVGPDGRTVATLSKSSLALIKDLRSGQTRCVHVEQPVEVIAVGPTGKAEPAVLGFAAARVFLLDQAEERFREFWTSPYRSSITACAFFPGGDRVLIGDESGNLMILSIPEAVETSHWQAHCGPVRVCAVGSKGLYGASGGNERLIRLWTLDQHRELAKALIEAKPVTVSLLEDGGYVAAVDENGQFYVWQFSEGRPALTDIIATLRAAREGKP